VKQCLNAFFAAQAAALIAPKGRLNAIREILIEKDWANLQLRRYSMSTHQVRCPDSYHQATLGIVSDLRRIAFVVKRHHRDYRAEFHFSSIVTPLRVSSICTD